MNMKQKDLEKFIKQGETQSVEFKSSFNKSVIESLVAFANTQGGEVIVGVYKETYK